MKKLEVIATNIADVQAANRYGADRIELVSGIAEGGLTPSLGLIEAAVKISHLPINVMIRPHSQSFIYHEEDLQVMLRDIHAVANMKVAGVVLGTLTKSHKIDFFKLEQLLKAAGPLDVTFHRAFDELADRSSALQQLAAYPQIQRILTSGGQPSALEALPELSRLQEQIRGLGGRPKLLVGSGLTPETLENVLKKTGTEEVHFGSAVREKNSYTYPLSEEKIVTIKKILQLS